MTITTNTISKDVFKKALTSSRIRKSSVKNVLRQAILDCESEKELTCSIHYQSYKDLQRELLANKTHFILQVEQENKNVIRLYVTNDVEIIESAYNDFTSNDKKFRALLDDVASTLEQESIEQVESEQVASI